MQLFGFAIGLMLGVMAGVLLFPGIRWWLEGRLERIEDLRYQWDALLRENADLRARIACLEEELECVDCATEWTEEGCDD